MLTPTPNHRKEADMITHYTKQFVHYLRHNRAVSALEYAILVGVVASALAAGVLALVGDSDDKGLRGALKKMGDKIQGADAPEPNLKGKN